MSTEYDYLLPVAKKLIAGLSGKPGIQIVDKQIAAQLLAQALNGAIKRGEIVSVTQVFMNKGFVVD